MKYSQTITLKNGAECILRNGTANDAEAALDVFLSTHQQTDNLLTYPDENQTTVDDEAQYLKDKTLSHNEIEIVAEVAGKIVGTAGISEVGSCYKLRHRAEFGIGIDREYWGLGIGSAMLSACIDCAKKASYSQLELNVVSDNHSAIAMYKKAGFVEFGRNPKGFRSRVNGYQELVYMRLDLE